MKLIDTKLVDLNPMGTANIKLVDLAAKRAELSEDQKEIVSLMEDMLADAKKGRFKSFASCMVTHENTVERYNHVGDNAIMLLAAVELQKFRLMENMHTMDLPDQPDDKPEDEPA